MTKDRILSDLFKSEEFNSCIAKMKPEHLQDDLKSEVILILCESTDEKILGLHESGGLKFYTVRIILNLIQSNTSPFYKKYRAMFDTRDPKVTQRDHPDSAHEDTFLEYLLQQQADTDQEYAGAVFSILEKREIREKQEDQALHAVEELYWYDRQIVKLYMELGTFRAIEKVTGIPWESAYKTYKRVCREIKEKVVQPIT
jgi:hypothetical protein